MFLVVVLVVLLSDDPFEAIWDEFEISSLELSVNISLVSERGEQGLKERLLR